MDSGSGIISSPQEIAFGIFGNLAIINPLSVSLLRILYLTESVNSALLGVAGVRIRTRPLAKVSNRDSALRFCCLKIPTEPIHL